MDDQPTVKQALTTIRRLQAQLDAERTARSEPIAIVGMGCRFPGGADDPERFWRLLDDRVDAVTEVPADRWTVDEAGDPERRATRWGAFLDGVDRFDADFFGISGREAKAMDPQQRLLLEVAWEALERAGQPPRSLSGSRTGVFLGLVLTDYDELSAASGSPRDIYSVTGNVHAFPAGRLSFVLGLEGPSMVVETACSSSLVAIHLACRSLRERECPLALAGGVNLILSPSMTEMMASGQTLSPDGRCATFDARANGYVRGEGCGVLVLKRRSDAIADGDPVVAIIRGSAVNQDGRSTGLTAPNLAAQRDLLRQALEDARADAADIGYVETHGTGTPLGDPIEVSALAEVIGRPRHDDSRCVLGAVKTNIGHLEAAAGVAGVIKTALAMRHERIPAGLHLGTPNPRIDLEHTCLTLPTEHVPWPRSAERPRLAGVSSFGISGTNAHVIVAEPPETPRAKPTGDTRRGPTVVPLSARTRPALRAMAGRLRDAVRGDEPPELADIEYTAAMRRDHFEHRAALVVQSREELADLLGAQLAGDAAPGLVVGPNRVTERTRTVFVFSGQGSQWPGMGRDLLTGEPAFRTALEACDAEVRRQAGWSILEEIEGGDSARLERTDVVQPVLFAIGVALAELWRSRGVAPDAVVGHSMGEVAAAHVAGALSLPDAVRVICRRSALLHELRGRGAMAVVELSMSEAEAVLAPHAEWLSVAAANGPRSTVISGDVDAVGEVLGELSARDVFCRRIKVDVASHSPQVDRLHDELVGSLRPMVPGDASVPIHSTVTDRVCRGKELDAAYWARNVRAPVLFGPAIERLLADGDAVFVEIGPHPILLPAISDSLATAESSGTAVASMHRERPASRVLAESVGALYAHGGEIDWSRWHPDGGRCAPLPTYPWQGKSHWLDRPRRGSARRGATTDPGAHPLLGPELRVATDPDVRLRETKLAAAPPYLCEHRVAGEQVLPAAACLDLALAAAHEADVGAGALEEVALERMIPVPDQGDHVLQLAIEPADGDWRFRLFGREANAGQWVSHVSGFVAREAPGDAASAEPLEAIRERCSTERSPNELYERFGSRGMDYGPAFRAVERRWSGEREALARVALPAGLGRPAAGHRVHPVLLDAGLQVLGAVALGELPEDEAPLVPVAVERVRVLGPAGERAWAHGQLVDVDADGAAGELRLLDDRGRVRVELTGVRMRLLAGAMPARAARWPHAVEWRDAPSVDIGAETAEGTWIVLADRSGVGSALAAALRERGARCVTVEPGGPPRWHEDDRYEIDPADEPAWQALLGEVHEDGRPCRGLVHLWSLDAAPPEATDAATLAADAAIGPLAALGLIKAAIQAPWRDTPRLHLVTRGAQAAGPPAPVSVAQAPLWGFARTLAMEHPELRCKRVDLGEVGSTHDAAQALLAELLADDREDEVALRQGERQVARVTRTELPGSAAVPEPLALRGDRTYLITGGLGGLGLRLSEWMIARGARHLALVGRGGATPAVEPELARLRAAGAEVMTPAADVTRPEEVAGLLAELDARMPPLAGVVHAAMVLDDRTVLQLDPERFLRVFAPKAQGAWNLHAATLDRALDLFVLYSSASALLGSPGQANYAAANAFLGALAHHRRAAGLPALCVDWGLFSEAGIMASREADGERLGFRGVGAITPSQGLATLERLLADPPAQIGVLDLDLRQWLEFYPAAAGSSLLSEVDPGGQSRSDGRDALRAALEGADRARRRELLADLVTEQLGRTLQVDPDRIDRSAPFTSLGLDSLMGLETRSRLEAQLGVRLSVSVLFASPTVEAVAAYLDETVSPTAEAPADGDRAPTSPSPEVEALSTDAVVRVIDDAVAGAAER